ncbi:hypothetical protein [Pedobacter sp. KACC 23697]|uniref:SMI1/KNR4 family protein n=1 Tax=Pedobacter sp. KACC 23697 TaxID=3149230 RepID=A0AAU7K6D1_9SPHI
MKKQPVLNKQPEIGKKFPIAESVITSRLPVTAKNVSDPNFSFSFKYYKQIPNFEVGQVPNNWFVSLIDRLTELCKKEWASFEKDYVEKKAFRYHAIDWGSKNIPIQRGDLNWIDKHYLENEEDFPMFQFHVSKALGRVVGFWDGYHVFQIVLLDPEHNIQPSNYNAYKIRDTYFMNTVYGSLLADLTNLKKRIPENHNCEICDSLQYLPTGNNDTNLINLCLSDDYFKKLQESRLSITDVIELGIASIN